MHNRSRDRSHVKAGRAPLTSLVADKIKKKSRKPDFSPEASVGANAASEARKGEPGLPPPATLFRIRLGFSDFMAYRTNTEKLHNFASPPLATRKLSQWVPGAPLAPPGRIWKDFTSI